jgi:hypothetical protein
MHTKNMGGSKGPPTPTLGLFNIRQRARLAVLSNPNTPVPEYAGTPITDEL